METPILTQSQAKETIEQFLKVAESNTQKRAQQFQKYQSFICDGQQWTGRVTPKGNDPCLSFNQSEDFVDTYLAKLFPRNAETGVMEVGVKVKEKSSEKREQFEKEILDVYRKSKLAQILIEQGQNFLIGGDGCLYYPQDAVTGETKIISLDPSKVYMNWAGSKLIQFAFEDEITMTEAKQDEKKSGWLVNILKELFTGETDEQKKFKPVKRLTYWDENFQIIKIGDVFETRINTKRIIPASWIPNKPKTHTHEGRSEAKMIYDLEQEYNSSQSDFGARVKNNTKAKFTISTDVETNNLTREDLDDVLLLDKDGHASFLTVPENPDVLNYSDNIARRMAIKFGINSAVQGDIKSNVSSLAMMYYFSPLLDKIGLKRIYWDEAFRELNRAILANKFSEGNFETDPVYQPVMALDSETKIKNIVLMLQNHLISYQEALDVLHGGENAIEKFKQIKTEYQELAKIDGFLKIESAATAQVN